MNWTVLFYFLFSLHTIHSVTLKNEDVDLDLVINNGYIELTLKLDQDVKLSGQIGSDQLVTIPKDCEGASNCVLNGTSGDLNVTSVDGGFRLSWESTSTDTIFQDCFDLNISGSVVNWFGGQEQWNTQWPLESIVYNNYAYRSSKNGNGAVAESYWLNSKGGYIFVDERVPLFLEQNSIKPGNFCLVAKIEEPFINRNRVLLDYAIVAKSDAKQGQLHAIENYLGKPSGHPNEWIVRNPIWTTWAKYKKDINDSIVLEDFAKDIANHGFKGQLEIDDLWETCYGSLTFSDKFSNISNTVKALKDLGFTVTLWVHPFINADCENASAFGREKGYFVENYNGSDDTSWWDGAGHHLDFTKEEARNWFTDRLKQIQKDHGIDSFKFDAGENDWAPHVPKLQGDIELAPNSLTTAYLNTVAAFGDLVEVRSAWKSQNLPIFVRVLDKDSRWGTDNGLKALVITLIQMNLIGYPMVLPDMIGGNGYDVLPTAEILARWIQANAFMPSMQFSYLPWDITSNNFDGNAIIKKFVDLHSEYADDILEAMENSVTKGTPLNPPIWWLDPTNPDALKCDDEFLLGEKILVAPVMTEGATSRDVVLPLGSWKDGNSVDIYEGPQIIKDYKAPIDILPYFLLVDSKS